mmetsp:Transcript_114853/g.223113  ORF Transcript_114853/g.223113 Transcript_114853/m.223113 type:complete len:103 (+) Transcript_114853:1-309(+)
MDRQLWAAGHSEVLEAAAENDKNEEVLAGADRRERQKRMQPSLPESPNWIDNCEDGVLDGNLLVKRHKTIDGFVRQESECSTAVPDGFARQLSEPESPSMAF